MPACADRDLCGNRSSSAIRNLEKPVIILEQQQSGSEFSMLSDAIRQTFLGLVEANKSRRSPAALSHFAWV